MGNGVHVVEEEQNLSLLTSLSVALFPLGKV